MSFYNHKRKSKAEIEGKRKLIADMLAGRIPIPKQSRITGIWIYEPNTKTYRSGDQVLTIQEYERLTAEDDAAENITGMEIDNHRIVMMPDPRNLPLGTNPDEHIAKTEPTKAIQPVAAPKEPAEPLPKGHPWFGWKRKIKRLRAEPEQLTVKPKAEPVRVFNPDDMTTWSEHLELNEQFSRTFSTSNYGIQKY
jgi:hypothetical protein